MYAKYNNEWYWARDLRDNKHLSQSGFLLISNKNEPGFGKIKIIDDNGINKMYETVMCSKLVTAGEISEFKDMNIYITIEGKELSGWEIKSRFDKIEFSLWTRGDLPRDLRKIAVDIEHGLFVADNVNVNMFESFRIEENNLTTKEIKQYNVTYDELIELCRKYRIIRYGK